MTFFPWFLVVKMSASAISYAVGFVNQVGDAGPVLDMMGMMLENISATASVSRLTISAVYRTAQIIASLPNLSYRNKVSLIFLFVLAYSSNI